MPPSPKSVFKFRYHHVHPFSHAQIDRVYRLFVRKVESQDNFERRHINAQLKRLIARMYYCPDEEAWDVYNVIHQLHVAYPHSLMRPRFVWVLDQLRQEYNDDSDDEDDREIQEQHNRDAQRYSANSLW